MKDGREIRISILMAVLPDDELKECNLGYRSKYVVRTARSIVSGEVDLAAIEKMPYKKAKEALLQLFGVGVKVADCICLLDCTICRHFR